MNTFMWELGGLIAVALLAAAKSIPAGSALHPARRAYSRLGNQHGLAIVISGVLGFAVSAAASAVRVPVPAVHDEFSYLLAADTYAQGRLTNPTHPHWQHFESFHVIHQPTYASKFPPAQGLLLAVGIVLGGHPIVGVWIGMGLSAAALCWMLQGWLPGRWALFGTMIYALHPALQFTSHLAWGNSYWGGAAPLTGGALVFGALPRLLRDVRFMQGVALASGAVVLANSRPYEGLIACVSVAAVLAWQLLKGEMPIAKFTKCVLLPTLLVLGPAAAGMAYYNERVTGRATMLPYQLHEAIYSAYPLFLFREPPSEPDYRHAVMRRFHVEWGLGSYLLQRNLAGWLCVKAGLYAALWNSFCGPLLTIPLVAGIGLWRRFDARFACGALLLALAGSSMVPWTLPHYLAPAVPVLWLLMVLGWRRLRVSGFGGRFALGLVVLYIALFAMKLGLHWTSEPSGWQWGRQEIQQQLAEAPGDHLVFVHYSSTHNTLEEWVYNEANLDAAKVVWARIMSPEENAQLIQHYADRQVWIVDADARPPVRRAWRGSGK